MAIKAVGHGFNSHPGQSFPLSSYGPNSISRANTHMVNIDIKLELIFFTIIVSTKFST